MEALKNRILLARSHITTLARHLAAVHQRITDHEVASQSFDISVWQFLAAPLFGARVDIVPNTIAHDPQGLLAHVQSQSITVLESVPSLIQGMLAQERMSLDGLRWMLPTGEAMPPELAHQ